MRFWRNASGCCCDDAGLITPCCYGGGQLEWIGFPPVTLYLSDGLGAVTLTRGLSGPVLADAPNGSWWGCASRAVTGGRASTPDGLGGLECTGGATDFNQDVYFNFRCQGEPLGTNGFDLTIYVPMCTAGDLENYITTHPDCTCESEAWSHYTAFMVITDGRGLGFNPTLPDSCDPFSVTIEQDLEADFGVGGTYSYPPGRAMTQIYGAPTTWTITE